MLIRRADLDRIAKGEVTLAFRRWRRPTVKAGGTLRTAAGLLRIDAVDEVNDAGVSEAEARAARQSSRAALWLKTQIRKLKALGLTESLEVGYRLSPRGAALLKALG